MTIPILINNNHAYLTHVKQAISERNIAYYIHSHLMLFIGSLQAVPAVPRELPEVPRVPDVPRFLVPVVPRFLWFLGS